MLPRRARLFSVLALVSIAAVNAAGLWSIAGARRAVREETARVFRADAQARARAIEDRLVSTRADLTFLAGATPVTRLVTSEEKGKASDTAFRRQAAEAALLLFLRAHPEVTRLSVLGADGRPLVLVGRRGGVPILWVASQPTGDEGPAVSPDRLRLAASIPLSTAPSGAVMAPRAALEAEIAASVLLTPEGKPPGVAAGKAARCRLVDAQGAVLAREAALAGPGGSVSTTVEMDVSEWGRPAPWRLECALPRGAAVALVEPLAARYRTTLALNVGAMALAFLLGLLTVREVRQRERLEAMAHEEARVRDLERQLFHAERLTSVGRLAAGIAHEINNPLEGMANYLSLATEAIDRGDTDLARRRLEGIRQGLERAALVVRQVLAHADPSEAPKGSVDLAKVLADTAEFVRSRPEFARVRFESELPRAPVEVEGSEIMLGQVALNLIVNACEAQPGGGEVRVSARREGDVVVAEVADRGPGIPAAERARIFEPFYSTKRSTGLGLSICHSIVRQHGGRLDALPREGGGSIFRMDLPARAVRTEVA